MFGNIQKLIHAVFKGHCIRELTSCKKAHENHANMCYRYKVDIDQMSLKFCSKRKRKTNYVEQGLTDNSERAAMYEISHLWPR